MLAVLLQPASVGAHRQVTLDPAARCTLTHAVLLRGTCLVMLLIVRAIYFHARIYKLLPLRRVSAVTIATALKRLDSDLLLDGFPLFLHSHFL